MISAAHEPDAHLASREANHRFLNTLTALHGLLRRDFDGFADPAVLDAVDVFSSRIRAFAGLHRTLGEDPVGDLVGARAHLARLCAELTEALLAPRGIHCAFSADAGLLPRETCRALSLAVVELVTNAAKHAFIGRRDGRIRVSLRRTQDGWDCQVTDNGCGLQGSQRGDGMGLVRRLMHAISAELRVYSDEGGVSVTMIVPQAPALDAARVARQQDSLDDRPAG